MANPSDYRFSESHEWFHLDDDVVTLGITPYATDELTDITYVEMRQPGTTVGEGDPVGEVESVKTTSEIFTVVGGEIIEVNEALDTDPALLNRDPLGDGWLLRLRTTDASALETLMDQSTYDAKHPVG